MTGKMDEGTIVIENKGNHFIMDSEQVVSNPFEEKQNEALNMGKRASVTEKLTSAKNNLCENHFVIRRGKLEREVNFKMKKLHDNSSRLRYEVKLFDIHKRKNELVVKKRVEPERDFTYDATQIHNSEKRLGVMSDCYYLEKRQQFKLRDQAKKSSLDTPMVNKAREFLRQQKLEEQLNEGRSSPSKSHVPIWKRRESRSAPASSKHSSARNLSSQEDKENISKLPNIQMSKKSDSHVKFSLDEAISNMRTSTPDLFTRSLTFFSGMRRKSNVWRGDDDDDDDDDDYIDTGKLRTLLYGDQWSEGRNSASPSLRTSTRESARSMSIIRRNQNRPITQEMMQHERKRINSKIKKFFDKIEIESVASESDEEKEEKVAPPPAKGVQSQGSKMMNVFSKPVEKTTAFQAVRALQNAAKTEEERKSVTPVRARSDLSNHSLKSGKDKKNLWEYIQVQLDKGKLRKVATPNQLILQQMTGLDLMKSKEQHIPLNSANRALRHTPTFKMRQVVQNLMQNRTKFEQQEVETLRKQIGGPEGEGEGQQTQEGQSSSPVAAGTS